jgi:hypothetical protein
MGTAFRAIEQTTAQAAYIRRIAQIQRELDRLSASAVRDTFATLGQIRARVVADLALTGTEWTAFRLNALLTAVDTAAAELNQRLGRATADELRAAWTLGSEAQARALGLTAALPAIDVDSLVVAQQMNADLVRRVSHDFRARAAREVTLTVAGAQSPHQAMQHVGGLLRTQPGRAGMGTIAAQAERIVRTETMGAFNLADRARDGDLAEAVPGLRKWWDAANDSRTRPDHRAAEARYRPGGSEGPIPLNKDFIVGGEKAAGPHDPRLSAAQRVHCRCVRMLWSPEW